MSVEKLGFFRKLLIGLGKNLYYRKCEKVNVLGLGFMMRELLRDYQEVLGGTLENALTEFEKQIKVQAAEVISKLISEPIMMGISMSYALSRDINDLPFITQVMFHGMIGKDYYKVFEYPRLILNQDGSGTLVIRMKQCIMCAGINDIAKEDIMKKGYGGTVATLFGTVIKEAWDYMEMSYQVLEAKETKCFLRGDPYGEITITFAPKPSK
jgi:hypothetical protein